MSLFFYLLFVRCRHSELNGGCWSQVDIHHAMFTHEIFNGTLLGCAGDRETQVCLCARACFPWLRALE